MLTYDSDAPGGKDIWGTCWKGGKDMGIKDFATWMDMMKVKAEKASRKNRGETSEKRSHKKKDQA